MVGEHVGEILHPLAGFGLEPRGGRLVARGAGGARDLSVADVPHEHVPERVLALAFHRARAGRPHELLARQLVQRQLHLGRVTVAHRRERTRPEHLAEHRGVLEQALPLGEPACRGGRRSAPAPTPAPRPRRPVRRGRRAVARTPPRTAGFRRPAPAAAAASRRAARLARRSAETSCAVSVSLSGARLIRCALRAFAPNVGCRSYSSGRAVHRSSNGTPSAQSARCSRKASSAGSAQCRSSNTSTVVRSAASASQKRRQAANDSSWAAGSAGAPTSGASRARSQARSASSSGIVCSSFAAACAGRVRFQDAALRLHDLAQCPERDPVSVGKTAALPPARRGPARASTCVSSSAQSRLLPTPGSPTTVTS